MARIAALIVLVLLYAAPAGASAIAPEYVSSEPEDGAKLHEAPDRVTATFSEPLDPGSRMIVEDHCGNRIDDRAVEVSLNEMSVGIAKKPSGHYIVTYAADGIGGATGSTEGTFDFEVHAGTPCDGGNGGHQNHDGGRTNHEGRHGNGHNGDHGNHDDHRADHGSDTQHDAHDGDDASHTDHNMSSAAGSSDHGQHAATGSQRKHGGHAERETERQRQVAIASGETPFPTDPPDSTAIWLALALCAAFGGLGGSLLRVSARK